MVTIRLYLLDYRLPLDYRLLSDYRLLLDYRILSDYRLLLDHRLLLDYRLLLDHRLPYNLGQVAGIIWYNLYHMIPATEVHRYYRLCESIIPLRYSHKPYILAEFIKTLLVLRNILIVKMFILRGTPLRRSSRNLEDSSTVSSD